MRARSGRGGRRDALETKVDRIEVYPTEAFVPVYPKCAKVDGGALLGMRT